jgi:hypothetical protein
VRATATVAAVVVGVCSYLVLAFQLWWDSHGEAVTVGAFRFTFTVVDFAGELYLEGRKLRKEVDSLLVDLADRVYYLSAELN